MIEIEGIAYLKVKFTIKLDMTEATFDELSTEDQDKLMEETIDWHETLRNAETESFDIHELEEIIEST